MSQILTAIALVMTMLLGAEPAAEAERQKEEELYRRGTAALDAERWTSAIASFRQITRLKGARADRALYWMGHAQYKSGRAADALTTLGDLRARYPKSEWIDDAQALELEIRQSAGQQVAPEAIDDEDLKLIAITGLLSSDQERAVTILEKILKAKGSRETKERALFVLSQSSAPRAQQIVERVARGSESPDLQEEAIRALGITHRTAILADIYRNSNDVEVKGEVLQSLMIAGDKARMLEVATGEPNVELRGDAVRNLGIMHDTNSLMKLYATEKSEEVKDNIIQGLFIAGDVDNLTRIARTETDPDLRKSAIRGLGIANRPKSQEVLLSLWNGTTDVDTREAVIEALFIRGDAKTLIALARKETNRELKRELVQKISVMQSKEAHDYMREILDEK